MFARRLVVRFFCCGFNLVGWLVGFCVFLLASVLVCVSGICWVDFDLGLLMFSLLFWFMVVVLVLCWELLYFVDYECVCLVFGCGLFRYYYYCGR